MSLNPECPKCGFSYGVEPAPAHKSHAEHHGAHIAHMAHKAHVHPISAIALGIGVALIGKFMEKRNHKEWKCTRCGHEF